MKINLFTSYFDSGNPDRQAELNLCLEKNYQNNLIDKIYLIENNRTKRSKKIKSVIGPRPMYRGFFNLINSYSKECDINIIANSDIYFDETLGKLRSLYDEENCFALSRSDLISGTLKQWHNPDSQDAWIFFGSIKKQIYGNFFLGKPGSDNRIAYEINKAGYQVINLCKTITIVHVHTSQVKSYIRNDEHIIPAPYLLLDPQ